MANTDRPSGFKPVRYLNGAPWNGQVNIYYLAAGDGTATFIGDAVVSAGSADATGHYPTVQQATNNQNIRGVIVGFSNTPYVNFDVTESSRVYRPGLTAMYCALVDDPNVIFEVQEDSDTSTLDADSVGQNADIVVGSGNTTTGLSAMELDSDSPSTTASAQCRILGLVNREDNELGTNAKWLVVFNEHEFKSTTGV